MIDADISDAGIAVMCDIARVSGLDLDADKRVVLDGLIAEGLIEVVDQTKPADAAKFALTPKGQRLLDQRGVGVNES
jgi:predicted transcriptional regulator